MHEQQLLAFVLILTRVTAFIGFFPMFGPRQVPAIVKVGLGTALTLFWFGAVQSPVSAGENVPTLWVLLLIFRELGIGLLLSMLLGLLLIPARIAGSYIGQEIGISMEPVTQSGTEPSTVMASIFETLAILMFFGLNLHHFMILILHLSMTELANKINFLELPTAGLIGLVEHVSEYGLMILAPIGVLSFVMVMGLFFLSKAAPTMNLFSVGMPLRVGLGIFCLVMFLPVLLRSIEIYFRQLLTELEQFMGFF